MTRRSFDVVLWGATGFTGKLVAEYLAKTYGTDGQRVRWAIAGRSREKLEAVRRLLVPYDPTAAKLPILIGKIDDAASMRAIAKQTLALCATAGPFAKYGSPVVDACVAEGTHYCDITGEVQWVKRMIERHHAAAQASGTRIVHCCGYDSIPTDLGVFVLEEHAKRVHGVPVRNVKSVVTGKGPGMSGGTYASMLNLFEEAEHDPRVLEVLDHPFTLCPEPSAHTGSRDEQERAVYDPELSSFTVPFIMAAVNTRVVHRSNALLDYAYGQDFTYLERMRLGRGVRGALKAQSAGLGLRVFPRLMRLGPARRALSRSMPAPGEGPSPEQRQGAYFALHFSGSVPSPEGAKPISASFGANGDPGYGETAKMVAESALCLALDQAQLRSSGGVLTPAHALGMALVERLRCAHFSIEVSG